MKKLLFTLIIKFGKGTLVLFGLNLLLILSVFTIQACNTEDSTLWPLKKDVAFIDIFNFAQKKLSSVKADSSIPRTTRGENNRVLNDEEFLIYLIPSEESNFLNNVNYETLSNTINDLNSLALSLQSYGLKPTLEDNNNSIITVSIPSQPIINALDPAVVEARLYLNQKGLSDAEIDNMILEENGTKYDLIPLVTYMAHLENQNFNELGSLNLLVQSTYAADMDDIINCGIIAVGADLIYALQGSNLKTWSKPLVKKAFKTVAQRALGPIGAAIAVVSFAVCLTSG
jgi:hypothetical protein